MDSVQYMSPYMTYLLRKLKRPAIRPKFRENEIRRTTFALLLHNTVGLQSAFLKAIE